MIKLKLKIWQKNVLSILTIIIGGFILFNIAFMFAAVVMFGWMKIMGMSDNFAPPFISKVIYFILIVLISFGILKSKLNTLIKATYFTMPLMVVIVMIGIAFYQQSKMLIFTIGALIIGSVLFYLYKKKLPWQFYFATLYVAVLGICVIAFDIQI